MIEYKVSQYVKFEGWQIATITGVYPVANDKYDPSSEYSHPYNLTIEFLVERAGAAPVERMAKFVRPEIGDKGLFSQLCEAANLKLEEGGGKLDEQLLVNKKIKIFFELKPVEKDGVTRVYDNITQAESVDVVTPAPDATPSTDTDLPF